MKPPRNHRPGGPGRPPPDRGPRRDFGGTPPDQNHPTSDTRHETRGQGRPGFGGPRPSGQGGPNPDRSQSNFGARSADRPRSFQTDRDQQGQRPYQPRSRHDGPRHQSGGQPHGDRPGPHAPQAPRGTVWLYGHHAVAAALANQARRLRRLLLTEEAEAALAERLAPPWPLPPERADRGRLDHLLGRDVVHQGAAVLADPLPQPSLVHALERPGPLIVLDQVTDPRNVGAILRSAAAFGAAGVITQDRNAPEETGALAKAASGALETVPLLRAVNIARTLIVLKASNLWVVGLDVGGTAPLSGPALAGRRVAVVLGAEGSGLRRLTRETCDEVVGLATRGAMESLNVSAAAAVALYELTRSA
jgi:23S rRNA (guanosine2251-2'-O)-methyltransferase